MLKKIKSIWYQLVDQYQFYRKFNLTLPKGCLVKGMDNIVIGDHFAIGANCELYAESTDRYSSLLKIGNNVSCNTGVMLNAECDGEIIIGNDVLIGPRTVLRASNHNFSDVDTTIRTQGHSGGKIILEDGVWIGANVTILPDVRIGKGAIVGAGSIVTKDISAYAIAVGNPAREIKSRYS